MKTHILWGSLIVVISLLLNIVLLIVVRDQKSLLTSLPVKSSDLPPRAGGVQASHLSSPSASTLRISRILSSSTNVTNTIGNASIHNGSSAVAHAGSSAHKLHHGPHQHDALLYLFNALMIGAVVMQISEKYPVMQTTVVLFVIGFIVSLVFKGLNFKEKMGVWGDSYDMWMQIDPHLLLFTLLPALLAGDAMTIDTSVARRVGMQCLYLAGPGVLIGASLTACFLSFYLEWSFLLSLCAGSILCATDPVAVVALLKELGASPMLTVQIQGESLLNDGTAIVLYLISYNMLSGMEYDFADICMFLVKKAMMAWALGLFIGYFFFTWLRGVSDKLSHSSSMIQITLTLCCAYWSYVIVEGVLGLSGVLATVASSLVLAHHMWPYVVSHDSMHHVWHTFESLGNIIIFFLAGSITGAIVVEIDLIDFLHLFVIYVFLVLLRGCLLFASRPILKYLSKDGLEVTPADTILMTWGGLRGAVGLALAIQVNNDRAPNEDGVEQITQRDAQRLLFFVSGIAFLTTTVNATTAPFLVHKLGITATSQARRTLLKMFHRRLVIQSQEADNPPEVTDSLKQTLNEAGHEVDMFKTTKGGPQATRATTMSNESVGDPSGVLNGDVASMISLDTDGWRSDGIPMGHASSICEPKFETNQDVIRQLVEQRALYELIPPEEFELLGEEIPPNLLGKVDHMTTLLKKEWVDEGMAKVVNQCFLSLLYNNYLQLVEEGEVRPGSPESDTLLTSVRLSLSPYRADLVDYSYIYASVVKGKDIDDDTMEDSVFLGKNKNTQTMKKLPTTAERLGQSQQPDKGCLGTFVTSAKFNIGVAVAILLNSVQVIAEEIWRDESNDGSDVWLTLDAIFTVIFMAEFACKFTWKKCKYFQDGWNRFDFILVVLGVFGLITSVVTRGGGADSIAGQSRIIRVARVLRTLRFLRIFRLFHARLSQDKFVSEELAEIMKKVITLNAFIRGHLTAQNDLIKFFGGAGEMDPVETEIARCILQSQVSTYKALMEAAKTQQQMGVAIMEELRNLHKRKNITTGLSNFVLAAHGSGAINASEANAILHPLNHQVAVCLKTINDRAEGVMDKSLRSEFTAELDHGVSRPRKSEPRAEDFVHPVEHRPVVFPGGTGGTLTPIIPDGTPEPLLNIVPGVPDLD